MPAYLQFPEWLTPEIIEGVPIRWYGILYLVAFLVSYGLYLHQLRRESPTSPLEESPGQAPFDLFFWSITGLVIGARLGYALIYGHELLARPWTIIVPLDENGQFTGWQGMSYHGGLVGFAIALIIYCRRTRLDAWLVSDRLARAAPAGYLFGRLGNFANGELFGRVSEAPWAVLFPQSDPVPTSASWVLDYASRSGVEIEVNQVWVQLPRHPSQLYEAFAEGLLLWIVLWFVVRREKLIPGAMTALYLAGYGIARFFVEYFRQPDPQLGFVVELGPQDTPIQLFVSPLNLSMGQVLSVAMILAAGLVYAFALQRRLNRPVFHALDGSEQAPGNDNQTE